MRAVLAFIAASVRFGIWIASVPASCAALYEALRWVEKRYDIPLAYPAVAPSWVGLAVPPEWPPSFRAAAWTAVGVNCLVALCLMVRSVAARDVATGQVVAVQAAFLTRLILSFTAGVLAGAAVAIAASLTGL